MRKYLQQTTTMYYDYDEVTRSFDIFSSLKEKTDKDERKAALEELKHLLQKIKTMKHPKYKVHFEPQEYVTIRLEEHNKEVLNDQAQLDILKKINKKTVRVEVTEKKEGLSLGMHADDPFDPCVMLIRAEDKTESRRLKTERLKMLRDAMTKLTPERQIVVTEYFFERKTMKAIGDELGKSDRAISQNLQTALKHLRKFMGVE